MKRRVLATLLLAVMMTSAARAFAQDTTSEATTTGPSNSVQGFLIVCAETAVLNFTGTSLIGYDLYYQMFSGAAGSGTAITGLRQVPVAGEYAVSDVVNYNSGVTIAAGGTASAAVRVARENNADSIDFEFVLSDTQDGCNNPTNELANSTDTGGGSSTTTGGSAGVTTNILAPFGGVLNPNLSPEPDVVIGARLSDRFRSQTPGLIFAECDAYPLAEPGIIYDNENVTIFWSWYTKTEEQMEAHLANAQYRVTFNTADLPMTTRSVPELRNGNYWVFYTAQVGKLRPGHYEVGYLLTWANPVSDGYAEFGPGTANPRQSGICNFDVLLNADGEFIDHTNMYFPSNYPVHNITDYDNP